MSSMRSPVIFFFSLLTILFLFYIYNLNSESTYNSTVIKKLLEKINSTEKLVSINKQRIEQETTTITQNVLVTPNPNLKQKFNNIFDVKFWGSAGGGSGPGSTVEYTARAREIIFQVVQEYKINSILDAPCGAMVWMPIILRNLTETNKNFKYHGIDLVDQVINVSKQKYSKEFINWKFTVFDFTQRPLPSDYDLIFSRDALQHLSLITIVEALKSFSLAKNTRYLLVGSYLNGGQNRNIEPGDYFAINLTNPPFNLKTYVKVYKEGIETGINQKHLILYDIQNYLSKIDFDVMKSEALRY